MKIVSFGGFPDCQINMANALAQKGHSVLMPIYLELLPKDLTPLSDKVETLGKNMPVGFSKLNIAKQFINRINEFKPDVLHLHIGGLAHNPLFQLALLSLKKYPLVSSFHDVKLHLGEKSLMNEFYRIWPRVFSDQIIVHGRKLRKQMIEDYNVSADKVNSVPLGEHRVTPFKKHDKGGLKENENSILFFGRIVEYKGIEYLIKAEPFITNEIPDANIIIAGRGNFYRNYGSLVKNKENFTILNRYVPYKEGAMLFRQSSIVVLPYIDASQTGVVHPAYYFKKPVVATNVGSLPEIVDNRTTGFIVPPKDPEALAKAIIELLENKRLRRKIGYNGFKKLRTELSWSTIVDDLVNVYNRAINK